jgi:hypothetical protein
MKLKRHGGRMRMCKRLLKRRKCFSHKHLKRSTDNIERYKVIKKTVKRAMSQAMGQMYDELYKGRGEAHL